MAMVLIDVIHCIDGPTIGIDVSSFHLPFG